MKHAISIYGTTKYKTRKLITKKPYKQRIHGKYHVFKAVKQHYVTTRKGGERFTIYGSPKEVEKAKNKIHKENWIPKRQYEDQIDAVLFVKHPRKYARKGVWSKFAEQET